MSATPVLAHAVDSIERDAEWYATLMVSAIAAVTTSARISLPYRITCPPCYCERLGLMWPLTPQVSARSSGPCRCVSHQQGPLRTAVDRRVISGHAAFTPFPADGLCQLRDADLG